MKTLKKSAIVLGLFSLLAGTTTLVRAQDYQNNYPNNYQDDGYDNGNVSLQTFYDELSPYGTWIQDPQYGYVWRPDVDQDDFRPYYTNGRWVMTEYGNTWVSNYNWGWAPFHYGRWVVNDYRQWIWIPDTTWGPAWVDWRSGGGYYGWAPTPPSISLNVNFGGGYVLSDFCWNFIPQTSIYVSSFPRYNYVRNNVFINRTTIINNTVVYNRRSYNCGPRIDEVRRVTRGDVTVYRYRPSNRPDVTRIDNRTVSIYRPAPQRNVDNRNAAPRNFDRGSARLSRGGQVEGFTNRDRSGVVTTVANNNGRDTYRNGYNGGNGNNQNNTFGRGDAYRRGGNYTNGRNNNPQDINQIGRQSAPSDGDYRNQIRTQRDINNTQQRFDDAQRQARDRGNNPQNVDQLNRQGAPNYGDYRNQRGQRFGNNNPQQGAVNNVGDQQMQQQRAQRDAQMQQQRAQRDAQMQQQRDQQMQQQRAQRDAQMQQQRDQQMQQQRAQQEQQQRAQRDAQMQQQRDQQMQQQRAQQEQQQRAQRDAQMQQQRAQQEQQQRAQRDAQMQQQRDQQMQQQRAQQEQQQRAQRDAQMQQQRAQQEQQRRNEAPQQNNGGGRPSRGGRG